MKYYSCFLYVWQQSASTTCRLANPFNSLAHPALIANCTVSCMPKHLHLKYLKMATSDVVNVAIF